MNIQEVDSTQQEQTTPKMYGDERAEENLTTFRFEEIEPARFDKEFNENMLRWGQDKNLTFLKFRFNLQFDELNTKSFLCDFFNSSEVRKVASTVFFSKTKKKLFNIPSEQVTDIEFEKLRCTQINLNLLDTLKQHDILYEDDTIKKCWGYDFQEIQIVDKIR